MTTDSVIDLLLEIEKERNRIREERIHRHGLEVELVNTTPALVGSWRAGSLADPERGLVEPPRPTDIAGKTRWWLRAILAAGTWEAIGKHLAIHQLDELAARLMGAASGSGVASRLVFKVEPLNRPWVHMCSPVAVEAAAGNPTKLRAAILNKLKCTDPEKFLEWCSAKEPQYCHEAALLSSRTLLTVLGKKSPLEVAEQLPLPPGFYQFRLAAYPRLGAGLDPLEERLLGYALGMALFFTGIGRGVTRGYGKLAPVEGLDSIEGENELAEATRWVYETLLEGGEHALRRIAEEATSIAREYIETLVAEEPHTIQRLVDQCAECTNLPLAYTLHPEYIVARTVPLHKIVLRQVVMHGVEYIAECNGNPWCVVAAINEAVKKTTIKNHILGKGYHGTGIGIPSYVLGLPRGNVYKLKGKPPRLLSMVHFTPLYWWRVEPTADRGCTTTPHCEGSLLILGFITTLLEADSIGNVTRASLRYSCRKVPKQHRCCSVLKNITRGCQQRDREKGCKNEDYDYVELVRKLSKYASPSSTSRQGRCASLDEAVAEFRRFFEIVEGRLCVNLKAVLNALVAAITWRCVV